MTLKSSWLNIVSLKTQPDLEFNDLKGEIETDNTVSARRT